MFVYCIRNIANGKKYVGATTKSNMDKRYGKNWWHISLLSNVELREDYLHHGKEGFELTVLARPSTKKSLERLEKKYITSLDTLYPNGYNFQHGRSVHPETKKRISNTLKANGVYNKGVFAKGKQEKCIGCGGLCPYSYKIRGKFKNTCSKRCFKESQSRRMANTMKSKRVPVIGTDMSTGKKYYFDSIKETKNMGFTPKGVAVAMKRLGSSKGFSWRKNEAAK